MRLLRFRFLMAGACALVSACFQVGPVPSASVDIRLAITPAPTEDQETLLGPVDLTIKNEGSVLVICDPGAESQASGAVSLAPGETWTLSACQWYSPECRVVVDGVASSVTWLWAVDC